MDNSSSPAVESNLSESALEDLMKERRAQDRILAFCQVYDLNHNFIGVSFDLTELGICLSLPNTWTEEPNFSVILKRADDDTLPEVKVTIAPIWRRSRNENFDEIGGRIVEADSESVFQDFLHYCQAQGPSGLFADN